jgi:uncharacterized protein YoxC
MNSLDILHYSLSLSSIIFALAIVYGIYYLAETLKELQLVLDDIKDTTNDIQSLKNSLKFSALTLTSKLLGKISERR